VGAITLARFITKFPFQFEPVVQPGNEGFVHHFVVNECRGTFPDRLLNYTGNCADYANMPAEVLKCKVSDIIAAWGVGGGVR
jgi:hypothetical protein